MIENISSPDFKIPDLNPVTTPEENATEVRGKQIQSQLDASRIALLKSASDVCSTLFKHAMQRRRQQREFAKAIFKDLHLT